MTSGNSNTEHPLRGEYTIIVITYTSQSNCVDSISICSKLLLLILKSKVDKSQENKVSWP